MKVSYFHLMPYQDLPRDFESRYHSAWVDLPNEHFDSAKGATVLSKTTWPSSSTQTSWASTASVSTSTTAMPMA